MHLETNFDDFVNSNGQDNFRTSMATAMKISEDRVLITNLRSGSVYVDFFLTSADTGEEEDSSEDPTAQATPPTPNDDSTLNSMLATM